MVVTYLDLFFRELLPSFLSWMNSLMLADGVSWLGLIVAVTLFSILIGSILMRVS